MTVAPNQPQSTDGTERGARSWRSCRQYPAVADHLQDWPRKRAGMVIRSKVTRGGLRSARPAFHHFDFRTQPTWQGIADVLPRHFINSVASCAPNQAREAEHEVPNFKSIWCPNVR